MIFLACGMSGSSARRAFLHKAGVCPKELSPLSVDELNEVECPILAGPVSRKRPLIFICRCR